MAELDDFVQRITVTYQAIREVWLIGSRANGKARLNSDWDLLVFADESTFQRIKKNRRLRRDDVDLLIVRDGNEFREPWGKRPKHGSLKEWAWVKTSPANAEYRAAKGIEDENGEWTTVVMLYKAIRIWPK